MLDELFKFVTETCDEFNIDESHGLTHSINVYRYGLQIYNQVLMSNTKIKSMEQIIICSCILQIIFLFLHLKVLSYYQQSLFFLLNQ